MQLVLLIFVIGVLNLCLGFATGMYLGYRPPPPSDARESSRSPRPTADISSDQAVAIEEVVRELEEQGLVSSPEESLPAEPEEVSDPVVEPELSDLDLLRQTVGKATRSLADLNGRLEKVGRGQNGRTAWSFVTDLQEICEPYLRHLSEVADRILDGADELAEGTAIGDDVEQVVLEQVAQLETTLGNLQHMDFGSGFSAAVARLRTDTGNTLSDARRLQNALETAPE